MKISEDGIRITTNFFNAIDILVASGRMRGLGTFTTRHDINRWNFITVKKNPTSSVLKPEWIYMLCNDFDISLEWIFFGTGSFYKS